MLEAFWAYLIVYASVLSVFVVIGYLFQQKKEKTSDVSELIDVNDLTVLVPFRNEEKRIGELLKNIDHLTVQPERWIFINDHSEDDGVRLVKELLKKVDGELLELPEDYSGKKMALREGIRHVETEFILTLDADVRLHPGFFSNLSKFPEADMLVLPAVMEAKKISEYLYEMDVALANAVNVACSGWSRPIMASGANLLYRKSTFDEVDDLQSHIHAASGDDTYLLRDFRKHEKNVALKSGLECAVRTETPQSFREFIDQRLRWIGKTSDINDTMNTSVAMGQLVFSLVFFTLVVLGAVIGDWMGVLLLFVGKTIIDLLVFLPYFLRIQRLKTWLLIPLYECWFPFYSLILFVLVFTYQPSWKGRGIYTKE